MADKEKGGGKGPAVPGGRKPSTATRHGLRVVGKGEKGPLGVEVAGLGLGVETAEAEKPGKAAHNGQSAPAQDILDGTGIERFCEMIADDMSYQDIADKLGIDKRNITRWVGSDLPRSVRVGEALKESARTCDAKALEALQNLPADPTTGQVAKAREIASHLRWRAKARNPAEYGDKMEVSGDISVSARDPMSLESALLMWGLLEGARKRYIEVRAADPTDQRVIEFERIHRTEPPELES